MKKAEVPPAQVDLAFLRAQELIAKDEELQRYCPAGVPILRVDKEYYLHVVNTLRGLPYTVVQPLSDAETQMAARVRHTVADVDQVFAQAKTTGDRLRANAKVVTDSRAVDTAAVDSFWNSFTHAQRAADEPMDTDARWCDFKKQSALLGPFHKVALRI